MIIGIGSDLLDMRRIDAVIQRQGRKFIDRIFTPREQERAEKRVDPNKTYAKMFAAKEAVVKALGTGVAKGVTWKDVEIVRQEWGPPQIILSGMALTHFQRSIPEEKRGIIHLTLTDEPPHCIAFVVLEAI